MKGVKLYVGASVMLQDGMSVVPIIQHKMKTDHACDRSASDTMGKGIPSSFHVAPVEKERSGLNVIHYLYLLIHHLLNRCFFLSFQRIKVLNAELEDNTEQFPN